jgi:Flp pilus assembly protein TadG
MGQPSAGRRRFRHGACLVVTMNRGQEETTMTLNLPASLRAFRNDRRGNFAMLFAVVSVAVSVAAGAAVDLTQALADRTHMADALDAAVLATAKAISTGRIGSGEAESYLGEIFAGNIGQSASGAGDFELASVAVDPAASTVSARMTATYRSAFGILGEAGTFPLSATAAASYGGGADETVEVAMAFDVTGSMAGSKIAALRTAALAGIATLLDNSEGRVRIAAIPYAAAVNVGPALGKYIYRDNGDPLAVPPAFDVAKPLLVKAGNKNTDNCATERKGDFEVSGAGPDAAMINRDGRLKKGACPMAAIVPLTSNAGLLRNTVDDFRADGTTAGHIGIQWAWYALSNAWSRFVPDGSAAGKGGKIHKYAVIMTDGEFNTAYAGTSDFNRSREAIRNSADKAIALCTAMKNQDIEIFTIGFGLKQANAIETLKACATPDHGGMKYFYSVSTGNEVVDVYKEIAAAIKKLRLIS